MIGLYPVVVLINTVKPHHLDMWPSLMVLNNTENLTTRSTCDSVMILLKKKNTPHQNMLPMMVLVNTMISPHENRMCLLWSIQLIFQTGQKSWELFALWFLFWHVIEFCFDLCTSFEVWLYLLLLLYQLLMCVIYIYCL